MVLTNQDLPLDKYLGKNGIRKDLSSNWNTTENERGTIKNSTKTKTGPVPLTLELTVTLLVAGNNIIYKHFDKGSLEYSFGLRTIPENKGLQKQKHLICRVADLLELYYGTKVI